MQRAIGLGSKEFAFSFTALKSLSRTDYRYGRRDIHALGEAQRKGILIAKCIPGLKGLSRASGAEIKILAILCGFLFFIQFCFKFNNVDILSCHG
jgi:hypothetical protein